MKKLLLLFLCPFLLLISCSIEPEKINYGSDACNFCQMTIVDRQHSAQYVTKKGKQFQFDAIECMLNELSAKQIENIEVFLVSDFGNPETMTDAKTSNFLITQKIKSPMGGFLSAFSEVEKANELMTTSDDKLYTWVTIKEKYDVK